MKSNINEQIFYALCCSEYSKVPILFMSSPGMGKSTTVELFAKIRGYNYEVLRGNSTSETEIMGYDVVDTLHPDNKSTIHLRPSWFERVLTNPQKTLLFLDEITTASEHVQSALLHLIFERKVGSEDIPETTLIVSAGNYSQSLGGSFGLIPPLMNRFCIYNIVPTAVDIDSFLSHYKGAALDKAIDWKIKAEKECQKLVRTPDLKNIVKIGEYFETSIRDVTKNLVKQGLVNLMQTDYQEIYTSGDNILRGFITLRSLGYLVTLSTYVYLLYGKQGFQKQGPFIRLVEGLVGIGFSLKGELSITTDYYYEAIMGALPMLEKIGNDRAYEYEKSITQVLIEKLPLTETTTALYNKLLEGKKDKELASLGCPISEKVLYTLFTYIKEGSAGMTKFNLTRASIDFTLDSITRLVTEWNSIRMLTIEVFALINDHPLYNDQVKSEMENVRTVLLSDCIKIGTLIKAFSKSNPESASLIPKLETTIYEKEYRTSR